MSGDGSTKGANGSEPRKAKKKRRLGKKQREAAKHRLEAECKDDSTALMSRPEEVISDLKLIDRSIKERWPTEPKYREALIIKANRIALQTGNDKMFFKAFETLLKAERQNQVDDHEGDPQKEPPRHGPITIHNRTIIAITLLDAELAKRCIPGTYQGDDPDGGTIAIPGSDGDGEG